MATSVSDITSTYTGSTSTTPSGQSSDFSTLSGSINFTGLGSGTDFNSIIDQLVKIESINKNRLEYWKSTWQAKIDSMTALQQRMNAVEEAAGDMDTANEFNVRAATSSDSGVASATASNSAVNGAYKVTVGSSIAHILRSSGCADAGTTAYGGAGGALRIKIGSTTYNVAVAAGDSLNTIASAINTAVGSTVATVENDGTSSRPYHLVLTSPTGGDAGRISILQNPTDLGLTTAGIDLQAYNTWSGSSTVAVQGQFSGDKSAASTSAYVFTINAATSPATIGADAFTINWTNAALGTSGSISVPASYSAGTTLDVENGFSISLAAGTVVNGDQFSLRAFANDIDSAELSTWTGSSTVTTDGNYLGSVNKTYSFTVTSAGAINAGGTAGTVVLRWSDSTGRTGTVSVADSDETYSVDQGLKLKLSAGTLNSGDSFQVNVFAPDQQQGQDKGLAQAAKVVHYGFADKDQTAITTSDGAFSYTYGGTTASVSVMAGTTLSQLVTLINSSSSNPGVTASVVNDGMGLPTSYRLVLTGKSSGAAHQITSVSHNLTALNDGGTLGGGFEVSQLATNSMVKVDGYPAQSGVYLQRSTNTISDVIGGVSVKLADAGDAVITVSTDTSAVASKIQALINAVNYTQSFIRDATKYDASTKEAGILLGNYSYYIIKSRVDTALNSSITGLTDGVDTYVNLAQIGIHTDPDNEGAWVIDSTTLMEALNSDPDAVANLFINNTDKGSKGAAKRMFDEMTALTDSTSGPLNVLINNYNGIITNIDKKIDSETKRLEQYRQNMVERFARMETTLSTLNSQAKALESAIAQLPSKSS